MDLGIAGKRALITGSSQGLGFACANQLAHEGAHVTLVARSAAPLLAACNQIRDSHSVTVDSVVADIATEEGRAAVLRACPSPDILVTNAGGPPPGNFRDWDEDAWLGALKQNMLAPIELIKGTIDHMIANGFGRVVNITSATVKAPIGRLGLSNGARAGLTGFVAGLAREVAAHNVTINNLLPGAFGTERLSTVYTEEEIRQRITTIPAGRVGIPSEFGVACAFLCGAPCGYITGQNLVLDGGAFRGVM